MINDDASLTPPLVGEEGKYKILTNEKRVYHSVRRIISKSQKNHIKVPAESYQSLREGNIIVLTTKRKITTNYEQGKI